MVKKVRVGAKKQAQGSGPAGKKVLQERLRLFDKERQYGDLSYRRAKLKKEDLFKYVNNLRASIRTLSAVDTPQSRQAVLVLRGNLQKYEAELQRVMPKKATSQ